MSGSGALGERAIGESWDAPPPASMPSPAFDYLATVVSQYANSPTLLAIVADFAGSAGQSANVDRFFDLVWNVDTAQGYGLDVWGRIVGVSRVLKLPSSTHYLGFDQSADGYPFGEGIFFNGGAATDNYTLSDTAYRRLILAKALANISDGSIKSINAILMALFSSYGNCYVTDGGDMTMTYTFGASLSVVDFAIVFQSGVLPRPAGVAATVVQL